MPDAIIGDMIGSTYEFGSRQIKDPNVSEFVVIDDNPFAEGDLKNHFVLISHLRHGIDEFDAKKAIEILNRRG